jgi:hypothetical protein
MGKAKRIEIIFHNGEPDGIRIYMRPLSTIKAFVVPRPYLNEAKTLTGTDNPGVYFLINDETGALTQIYIGQTRNGITRLDDHNAKKDFWNKAILFLANDEHFTLNIISGLEKYSIQRAMDANRYRVDNKAVPKYKISEYDFPLIEEIYEEIEFIMATLGYRMNGIDAQNVFTTSRRGVVAYGIYTGENFEVQPNSEIDFSHLAKLESYNAQRKALLDDGTIIKQSDGKYYLKKIIGFKTPSGAADFVLGGSNNGWVEWKDKDGKTLDELIRQSI